MSALLATLRHPFHFIRKTSFLAVVTVLLIGIAEPASGATEPFTEEYDPSLAETEVVLENGTDRSLTIRLTGPQKRVVKIRPRTTRRLSLSAGDYRFTASATGVASISGERTFAKQHRYVWTFRLAVEKF